MQNKRLCLLIFFLAIAGCSNPRSELQKNDNSTVADQVYEQKDVPTKYQVEKGMIALRRWKYATEDEKSTLAPQIVAGRVLIGLSQTQVVKYLGKPDLSPDLSAYSENWYELTCSDWNESHCTMNIQYRDSIAVNVYLAVD